MVAQQYGPQVRSDVITDTVQSSLNDAIRAQNLRVAGYPRIEPKQAAAADQFEFSAVFEVYPEITLGDLAGVKIMRPVAEVGPADVEHTLDILRKQNVRYEPAQRPARKDDRVTVDFSGTIDGVEFAGGQAKGFAIVLGGGRMLPEFDAALEGMSAGESKTFPLVFPESYHGAEVAGKTAQFALTVHSVAAPILPELDAEFARQFGINSGSIDELRAEITANLTVELRRKIESALRQQVMSALRSSSELGVPKSLVDMEADSLWRRTAEEMKQRGARDADLPTSSDIFRPQAEDRVAIGLILNEIVRVNQLHPKPEQVRALVAEAAQSYEQPDAVIRWHYEKPERLNDFETAAVEHNVIEWALGRAQVEDQPTTFSALMEPETASTGTGEPTQAT
jgi:trigger factor